MCKFRILNDSPVTMEDWEHAENVYDYEYQFEKNATEEEVEAMHCHESQESPMPYRMKKAITKIFRKNSYMPSLEDIEEEEEISPAEDYAHSSEEEVYDLSLSAIHQERAWRYCSRPKQEYRRRHHRHHRHHDNGSLEENQSVRRKRRRHDPSAILGSTVAKAKT